MDKNNGTIARGSVKVKNELLLRKMKELNILSVAELSRLSGVCVTSLLQLINKELSPQDSNLRWRPCVLEIAIFFSSTPYELFEEEQVCITSDLGQKRAKECFNASWETISFVLRELSSEERDVLSFRFGFGEGTKKTLEETKEVLKISTFRVGEIEKKAIRKVKHLIVKQKKKMLK